MTQRKKYTARSSDSASRGAAAPRERYQRPPRARADSSRRLITLAILVVGILIAGFVIVASFSKGTGTATVPAASTGDTKQAEATIASLQETLRQNPSDSASILALGNALYDQSRWAEAVPWYEKYLQTNTGNSDVQTDLGTAYLYSGNADKAKAIWDKVLQVEPNKVETHYNLGVYYIHKTPQDRPAAIKEFETVISVAPQSPQAQSAQKQLEALRKP